MRIYLAGPINGCSDAECNDWRTAVKEAYGNNRRNYGVHCVDPMKRDYRGREAECVNEIVQLDKRDIASCDVVVVMFVKPSVGTAMEVYYAWQLGIPVIVIDQSGKPLSPWLVYHSTAVVKDLGGLFEKLKEWS